ncbi:hypothetical protein Q3G72_009760 [Acer saccharum]|nr:hypothetical protein Q3G72_009760 [Acer saccharum]
MIGNISSRLHAQIKDYPNEAVNFRNIFESEIFGLSLRQIAINIYECNMDKKQWENPNEWNPERFFDSKYDAMDMYKTMAFGAGKRVCAGSLQAMLIACKAIG